MEKYFSGAVSVDPNIMSGTPVFAGTRVPVKNLFDYLSSGYSVDQFLTTFDWVKREQVTAVLGSAYEAIFESGRADAVDLPGNRVFAMGFKGFGGVSCSSTSASLRNSNGGLWR